MIPLYDKEDPRTDSERVYRRLRHDIICGTLKPEEKLKMVMLKARYDFGAAPIREALSRLASDRLVRQEGQRGFDVAPLNREDAIDVGRVRTLLETEALKDSLEQADDDWEAQLVATYHRLTLVEERADVSATGMRELEVWNQNFHEALVSAAKSDWIMELRSQIYYHHERYRHLSRKFARENRDTGTEHKEIFQAAMDRNAQRLCDLTSSHIKYTTDNVLASLSQN